MPLKKYLDYDGLAYLLQRFPKTTVHCTFDSEFAGETATLTHGTTTYTKTVPATSPYELTFAVNELGTWILNCSYLGTQYSGSVDITYLGQKGEVELTIVPDGSTVEPINSIPVWLKCANLNKSYTTLAEVLADTETYEILLADSNACQYMKRSTGWAGNSENLVPIMTSNTTPSGVVSAESFYSAQYAEYFAFNGSISNNGWTPNASATVGNTWIQYQFSEPTVISGLASFQYFPSGSTATYRKKTTFKIQGSNNGTNFVDLGTDFETVYDWNIWSYSSFENNTAYEYYRIVMTAVEGTDSGAGPTSGNGYKFKLYVGGITTDQDAITRLGKFDYASNLLLSDSTWADAIFKSDYWESVCVNSVPKMTSNTAPSGSVSGSGAFNTSYPAWYSFDRNDSTSPALSTASYTAWIQYDFGYSNHVYGFCALFTGSGQAMELEIKYSDDNSTFESAGTYRYEASDNNSTKYYKLNADYGSHRYWRMVRTLDNHSVSWSSTGNTVQFYGRTSEEVLVPLVPTMTSNTTPSGECFGSSTATDTYYFYFPFDGGNHLGSNAFAFGNSVVDATPNIGYDFGRSITVTKVKVKFKLTGGSGERTFKVQKSSNGSTYTDISNDVNVSDDVDIYVTLNNENARYFRLQFSGSMNGGGSGGTGPTYRVQTIQFYQESVQTNIIHSAPNDTIYMMENASPVVLTTTNSNGDGILDFSQLPAGPVTLYSSVAKNPENLTADYSKTITITKTQYGGTTEAYLMPNTIKTLYWWGNMANSGGFTNRGGSAATKTLTLNTYDIEVNVTSGACAVGTNQTINTNGFTKLCGITKATNKGITILSSPTLGSTPNTNSYGRTDGLSQNNTIEKLQVDLTNTGDVYTYIFQSLATNATSKSNTYAIWYE